MEAQLEAQKAVPAPDGTSQTVTISAEPTVATYLLGDADFAVMGKFLSTQIEKNNAGKTYVSQEDWLALLAIFAKYL